jgi:hypothetical protein
MGTVILILRIIHIFCGGFWVGFVIVNIAFLQPSIRATGAEGQSVMRHLMQKTTLLTWVYTSATLAVLAGLLLYWTQIGFHGPAMMSGRGLVLLIGGVFGILAWIYAVVVIRNVLGQMATVGKAIEAQGAPPTPEQGATMQLLLQRLNLAGQITLVFLVVTVLSMAVARYAV